jgi:dipeptidyl aminopeptidase/acylaminoacyl peptidase
MFFSAYIGGHSHLWRQRFPRGEPQQITFGPTEEETVFATPDGHSLLTSIGTRQDVLWLHDAAGARALTTEDNASSPWLSTDARRIYFLSANNSVAGVKLTRLDIETGSRAIALPEFNVTEYDIDPEEQQVVFTTLRDGVSQIWLTPLDRHAPPKLLVRGGDQAKFGGGKVLFRSLGGQANFLHRIDVDGNNEAQILSYPILNLQSVSPDGRFVSIDRASAGGHAGAWLISLQDHTQHLIGTGWFPSRWSRDGKLLYIEIGLAEHPTTPGRTIAVHVDAGGVPTEPIMPAATDARIISQPESALSVGQDPSVYAYVKSEVRRNIYRIPLH